MEERPQEQSHKRKHAEEKDQQVDHKRARVSEEYIFEKEDDINLGDFSILPNELRYYIISLVLADNISNWDDIFNFNSKPLKITLDKINLISKNFNLYEKDELKNFIKQTKANRCTHLREIIQNQYQNYSKEKLDERLIYLLNKYRNRQSSITQEEIKVAIRVILAGADIDLPNADGWTILIFAANNGFAKILRLLIECGADINITTFSNKTPLMIALERRHIEIVGLLIECGADIKLKNAGWRIFRYAAINGHTEIMRLLIAHRDPVIDAKKEIALMFAAEHGHMEIVELLIENGANINIITKHRWTALGNASYRGHTEIVNLLLQHGANIGINDALTTAMNHGHTETAELLRENGAKTWWELQIAEIRDKCCIS